MRPRLVLAAAATGPWPLLFAVGLSGWAALIGSSHAFAISNYCGAVAGQWDLGDWQGSQSLLQFNPPSGLVPHWMLMLLAMMSPLLAEPLTYVWRRSLARRRLRALTAFFIAYLGVWVLAGIPLSFVAIGFRELAELRQGWLAPAAIAVALLWQLTPAKQTCLNRCHRLPRLSPFGGAADRDCLRYGFVAAIWCVGACWGLMLVPLVVDAWHLAIMAAVSIVLIAERQARPRPARWGLLRPAL